jgi:signal transduction histidine kinase
MVGRPITDVLTRLPLLASSVDNNAKASRFELNGRYVCGRATILYDPDNQAQGVLTTLHDITDEFELEQSKDNFLKTISHELRTPLTAIKGYVELLSTGASGPLNANQKMFAVTIQRNVNRMVQLINSLIFTSSIRSGRLEYITGHTDLAQLIDQISRELQPTAAEDGQKIIVDVANKLQPLRVDPIHMATILEELITNSIKFNRPGGTVRVTAVPDTMNGNAQTYVIISISDEGIGIDPADQAHIFEEFYRTAHETDEHIRTRGLGMGLSIVRSLVETYNGRIWFKSTPKQGSTFTFIIPHQSVEENTPSPNAM